MLHKTEEGLTCDVDPRKTNILVYANILLIIKGLFAQVYLCHLTNISKRLFEVPICLHIPVLGAGPSITP